MQAGDNFPAMGLPPTAPCRMGGIGIGARQQPSEWIAPMNGTFPEDSLILVPATKLRHEKGRPFVRAGRKRKLQRPSRYLTRF